jgi:hypothetical protein
MYEGWIRQMLTIWGEDNLQRFGAHARDFPGLAFAVNEAMFFTFDTTFALSISAI